MIAPCQYRARSSKRQSLPHTHYYAGYAVMLCPERRFTGGVRPFVDIPTSVSMRTRCAHGICHQQQDLRGKKCAKRYTGTQSITASYAGRVFQIYSVTRTKSNPGFVHRGPGSHRRQKCDPARPRRPNTNNLKNNALQVKSRRYKTFRWANRRDHV